MNALVDDLCSRVSVQFGRQPSTIVVLFGTRPELIKLAPVIRELHKNDRAFNTIVVSTSQHQDLIPDLIATFDIAIDYKLQAFSNGQGLSSLLARSIQELDPVLEAVGPELVLVQGDTTSALAGALAARHRRIPVGHVEAGLRTSDPCNPFPEEMNRRLITSLATYHFAPTSRNVRALLAEGVSSAAIAVTGNPVVDALVDIRARSRPSPRLRELLAATEGRRLLVLTTHRRESFGGRLRANLRVVRDFLSSHPDVAVIFPVHPNPEVREPALEILGGVAAAHLTEPLTYPDFVHLLGDAWLIVSDSGGVQEEAPTLGKPVLITRTCTERPEVVDCGIGRLAGTPDLLARALEEAAREGVWVRDARAVDSPFGRGDSARRIVAAIAGWLGGGMPGPAGPVALPLPVQGAASAGLRP